MNTHAIRITSYIYHHRFIENPLTVKLTLSFFFFYTNHSRVYFLHARITPIKLSLDPLEIEVGLSPPECEVSYRAATSLPLFFI